MVRGISTKNVGMIMVKSASAAHVTTAQFIVGVVGQKNGEFSGLADQGILANLAQLNGRFKECIQRRYLARRLAERPLDATVHR
jgi:phosphoheptose isomerase